MTVSKWHLYRITVATLTVLSFLGSPVGSAQANDTTSGQAAVSPIKEDEFQSSILLTVIFRHDQAKPLREIIKQVEEQGFYERFPPKNASVVSWYVLMGVGQVVTLRVPADSLREINRIIEETAWGGFRTEIYATYDFSDIGRKLHAEAFAQ